MARRIVGLGLRLLRRGDEEAGCRERLVILYDCISCTQHSCARSQFEWLTMSHHYYYTIQYNSNSVYCDHANTESGESSVDF